MSNLPHRHSGASSVSGKRHANMAAADHEPCEIFVIVDARHSAHPLLKFHLVTAAQRGYSFGLLEVCGTKFA